ncbi:hypothetical protein GZH47_21880 [Paenibacillus rhizovicinus]|uniref:Uncharacterized protein n=1 Tax=Paenibacillus rhizovicinus TaxID=2704463 RepID=A0A6C0P3N3_9BACL|nr:hypothetical protein [Paenibacillus rhizovicinus]QHW33170.1 hypothetical protein GZH47_21880 [Paenibacillus rhizovicinus]
MTNKFITLLQYLSDEPLAGQRKPNRGFKAVAQRMEQVLNPRNNSAFALAPDKVCPLVSSGERMKYVILGLNPHDDGPKGDLHHLATWEELADYHVPTNLYGDNIFDRVLLPNVAYYRRVGTLVHSLEERRYIKWPDFRKGLNAEQTKEKYRQMIDKTPIGVAEVIPFASKKISLGDKALENLMAVSSEYRNYLKALLELIVSNTTEDAWIICNGSGACQAFEEIMRLESKPLKNWISESEVKKYALYTFKGKKVLMLYQFLNIMNGALNSHGQIGAMIEDVIQASDQIDNAPESGTEFDQE